MSSKNLTHSDLVAIGRRWLFSRYPIVISELSNTGEEPDVIGWHTGLATLIEAKVSLSDFYSDNKKMFRQHPGRGIGTNRYYLTPIGLLNPEKNNLRGWGLLETDGRRVFKKKESQIFEANHQHEKNILISCMRRIGQTAPPGVSVKAYYTHTGDRAALVLDTDITDPKGE